MQKIQLGIPREDTLILVGGSILALALRFTLLPVETLDFRVFFGPWYEYLRANGGFLALGQPFYNNTPVYLYLVAIASYVYAGLPAVFAVKLITVPFDFICAALVYKIVRAKFRTGPAPIFAFLAIVFAPTVFLNSSFWAETDILYTTCLVATLYFLIHEREIPAFLAFGLSLAIKLQALFFLPVLVVLLLLRRVSWKSFLLLPLVYLLTITPVWLLGRPLDELLLIYIQQSETYQALSMNAPNMYQWLPNDLYDVFYRAGMVWAAGVVFLFCVAVYRRRPQFSADLLVQLGTISLLVMPYVLPKMHERFTFPADVFSIIYGFYFPRNFYIPLLIIGVSTLGYFPFLFGYELVPLKILALVPPVILTLLIWRLAKTI